MITRTKKPKKTMGGASKSTMVGQGSQEGPLKTTTVGEGSQGGVFTSSTPPQAANTPHGIQPLGFAIKGKTTMTSLKNLELAKKKRESRLK